MKYFLFWFFTMFLSTLIVLEFYLLYRAYMKDRIIKPSDTARIFNKYSNIHNVVETVLGKEHDNLPLDYIRKNKLFQKHMTYYILHQAFHHINSYGGTFYIPTLGYMNYLSDESRTNIIKTIKTQLHRKYSNINMISVSFDCRYPEQIRVTTYLKGEFDN